ncbi:MAG: vanadium-dependent haloperoxidase [Gemmatimonadaceae bacterium]
MLAIGLAWSDEDATGLANRYRVPGPIPISGRPGSEVAVAWNLIAYETANAHDQFFSFVGSRALAMAHVAMHDALNAITPRYEQYAFTGAEPGADPVAGATEAAHAVLVAVYPAQRERLDRERERWLARVPDGRSKQLGLSLGGTSAAAILVRRQGDGHDATGKYTPGHRPGDYQFTPGFDFAMAPEFRNAKPFGLRSPSQFRAPPPPPLESAEYATSFNEVKRLGAARGSARSADQTGYAHWWAEFAEHAWNRIGRLTAPERGLDLWDAARMFALINMEIFDVYVASFDSKYHYHTWRPYTAIRAAAQDGNPETEPDPGWEPEMQTLPIPEYPSAHAAVGAGGAEVISHVYGTPNVSFRMQSVTALPGQEMRSYDNLDAAADECAASRVMNGFHFRFATEAGKVQGRKVARHLLANYLRPRRPR